jgi:hypothetical protein
VWAVTSGRETLKDPHPLQLGVAGTLMATVASLDSTTPLAFGKQEASISTKARSQIDSDWACSSSRRLQGATSYSVGLV